MTRIRGLQLLTELGRGTDPWGVPLVLHVIPTAAGRGAQRSARTLVDRLDRSDLVRHRLLSLFDASQVVHTDMTLGYSSFRAPAEGFELRLPFRLGSLLRELSPVVVVSHGGDPLKYLVSADATRRTRLVYCAIGTASGLRRGIGGRLHAKLWKALIRRADRVVAVGDEVRAECIERFGSPPWKTVMIPNGRDAQLYHPPRPARPERVPGDPATVVFAGALTKQKRPELFIDVIATLRQEGRMVRGLIAGDGPLIDELRRRAAPAGVEILGLVHDMVELLGRADVLVFPSDPGGEGMPGTLIEAGLCGVPVVTSPVPGTADIVVDGKTGLVVPGEKGEMARAVASLIDDPSRARQMGTEARRHCVNKFDLDRVVDKWREVIDGLIQPMQLGSR